MTVLDRYIIKEVLSIFFLAIFVLFSVLTLEKVNFMANLLLSQRAPVTVIGELMIYLSPVFMTLAIPLAVLMSTLMAFSRLSAENEITAMRAGGVSLYRLLAPVLLLSLIACGITFYLTTNLTHKGALAFKRGVIRVLQTNFSVDIQERRFYSGFPGLLIHINGNTDGDLRGVFIADERNSESPKVIEARRGRLVRDPDSEFVTLKLADGVIHSVNAEGAYRTIAFGDYLFNLDLSQRLSEPFEKEIPHLSIPELKERIAMLEARGETAPAERVAILKKYSLPVGCLALGLIGAPVGILTHRRGSAGGFGVGVLIIVLNYVFLMMGEGLGSGGKLDPVAAMWGPNAIMGVIGLYFIIRVSKDTMPSRAELWLAEAWVRLWRRKRPGGAGG